MDLIRDQNTPYFSWDWFQNPISGPLSYRDFRETGSRTITFGFGVTTPIWKTLWNGFNWLSKVINQDEYQDFLVARWSVTVVGFHASAPCDNLEFSLLLCIFCVFWVWQEWLLYFDFGFAGLTWKTLWAKYSSFVIHDIKNSAWEFNFIPSRKHHKVFLFIFSGLSWTLSLSSVQIS